MVQGKLSYPSPSLEVIELIRSRTRQLQDFGFQIAVPGAANAPLRPQKSGRSRRTPQPELPQQRSTRRTPKVTQPLPARSSKRTPLTANGKRLGRLPKGDLSKTQEEELPSSSRQTQSSADGSIAKKRKLAQLSQETNETTTMQSAGFTKPQQGLAIEGGGVNQEGSNEVRAKKRKKRKSIGQVSRKRIKSGLPDVLEEQSPPSQQSAAGIASEELQIRPDLIDNNTKVDDLPIASTSQQNVKKPRKKKRKSIGKIPKSRKKPASTNVVEEKTGTDSPSGIVLVEEAAAEEEEGEQDEGEQAEEEPTPKTMAPPSRSRGRPRKLLPTVDEETQDEDLDLGESVKPVVPARKMQRKKATNHDVVEQLPTEPSSEVPIVVLEAVTKPKHRRQKQLRAPSPASSQPKAKKPRQPRKDSIPITVHRLSQSHLLQPDRSNSDPESDTDILSLASSFPQKNSVNAVDVLSQVCSELIAKTISTLQQETQDQPSAARKAEWKRKRKAVEMFGEELNARLFQLVCLLPPNPFTFSKD